MSRVSISWLYLCNKSSYIRSVYSQCHVDSLKCTEQNVNNQTPTQVAQCYVHVSFCLKLRKFQVMTKSTHWWSLSFKLHGWGEMWSVKKSHLNYTCIKLYTWIITSIMWCILTLIWARSTKINIPLWIKLAAFSSRIKIIWPHYHGHCRAQVVFIPGIWFSISK